MNIILYIITNPKYCTINVINIYTYSIYNAIISKLPENPSMCCSGVMHTRTHTHHTQRHTHTRTDTHIHTHRRGLGVMKGWTRCSRQTSETTSTSWAEIASPRHHINPLWLHDGPATSTVTTKGATVSTAIMVCHGPNALTAIVNSLTHSLVYAWRPW